MVRAPVTECHASSGQRRPADHEILSNEYERSADSTPDEKPHRFREVFLRVAVVLVVVTAAGFAAPAAEDPPAACPDTHHDGNESDGGDACDPCDRPHAPENDCADDLFDILHQFVDLLEDLYEIIDFGA